MSKSLNTLNFLITDTAIQLALLAIQQLSEMQEWFHIRGKPCLKDGNKTGVL